MLYCRYGPTGLSGQLPTWKHWSFWYGRVPPEAEAIHEFAVTRQVGMVKQAVTECPPTTGAIARQIEGLPTGDLPTDAGQSRATAAEPSVVQDDGSPADVPRVPVNSPAGSRPDAPGAATESEETGTTTVPVGLTLQQALERVHSEFRAQETAADTRYVEALTQVRNPAERQEIIMSFAAEQQARIAERDRQLSEVRRVYANKR